jgi:hypothetical protein
MVSGAHDVIYAVPHPHQGRRVHERSEPPWGDGRPVASGSDLDVGAMAMRV